MRPIQLIIVILAIVFLTSCGDTAKNGSNGSTKILTIPDPTDTVLIEQLYDSIRFLQLEAPSDAAWIRYVSQLKFMNDKIYILDDNGASITMFDMDGKFIKRMAMQGRGPNEYLCLANMECDPLNNCIIAVDKMTFRTFIYDQNLNLVRHTERTHYESPYYPVMLSGDNIIAYQTFLKRNSQKNKMIYQHNLLMTDRKEEAIKGVILNQTPGEIALTALNCVDHLYNGDFLFLPFFSDTIYRVSQTMDANPEYILDFQSSTKKPFTKKQLNNLSETYTGSQLSEYEDEGYVYTSGNLMNTETHILFLLGFSKKLYSVIHNKQTEQSIVYDANNIKGDQLLRYMTKRPHAHYNNYLCRAVAPAQLKMEIEICKYNGPYREMIDKLDENGNPIIVFFKIKGV